MVKRYTIYGLAALLAVVGVVWLVFTYAHGGSSMFPLRHRALPENIADWQQFDGIWQGSHGTFSDLKGGSGDKAIAGSPSWSDYTVDADIRFDSDRNFEWGDAGIIVRVSDALIGTDSYNGYYAGLRLRDQMLVFSRSEDEYIQLATAKLKNPIQIGTWYHLNLRAQGCTFTLQVGTAGQGELGQLKYTDEGCAFRSGEVGIRAFSVQTSWRNVEVHLLP